MKTILIIFSLFVLQLHGQTIDFNVSVSNDTLLMGNYLEVKFEINNVNGKFSPPDFAGWNIVAGPNSASSYSIINGEVNQSSSYTFYLEAQNEGDYMIGPAKLKAADKEYTTPELKIVVMENPDGIQQHPKYKSRDPFETPELKIKEEPKKKRKTTKI